MTRRIEPASYQSRTPDRIVLFLVFVILALGGFVAACPADGKTAPPAPDWTATVSCFHDVFDQDPVVTDVLAIGWNGGAIEYQAEPGKVVKTTRPCFAETTTMPPGGMCHLPTELVVCYRPDGSPFRFELSCWSTTTSGSFVWVSFPRTHLRFTTSSLSCESRPLTADEVDAARACKESATFCFVDDDREGWTP